MAVWVRMLLPRVLGTHLTPRKDPALPKLTDESAAAALRFLDLCLAAVQPPDEPEELNRRGYPKWNAGTVGLGPEENALVRSSAQAQHLSLLQKRRESHCAWNLTSEQNFPLHSSMVVSTS